MMARARSRRSGLALVVVSLLGLQGCQTSGDSRNAPVTIEARADGARLATARWVAARPGAGGHEGLAPTGCAFPIGGPALLPLLVILLPFAIVWEIVSAPFELLAERM